MPVSRRTFCAAAVCAACAAPLPRAAFAAAGEMQLMQSMLEPRGRDLYLSMSWEFDLPETLVDSLRRGIPLYFVCEVNLQSKRWYWRCNFLVYNFTNRCRNFLFICFSRIHSWTNHFLLSIFINLDLTYCVDTLRI